MPYPKIVLMGEDIGLYSITVCPINATMKQVRNDTVLIMDSQTNAPYVWEDGIFYICLKPNGKVDGILDGKKTPIYAPCRPAYNPQKLQSFIDALPTWVMPVILDTSICLGTDIFPLNMTRAELERLTPTNPEGVQTPVWLAYDDQNNECTGAYPTIIQV